MWKSILIVAAASALCFGQTQTSKLAGKRIYLHRQNEDHSPGYNGLSELLLAKKASHGYNFEYTEGSANEAVLNTLVDRLYKAPGVQAANAIDILILCQGQGDQNIGGGNTGSPGVGGAARFAKVNTHLRSGGGLIIVHAAAGRALSSQNWWFGAKLMTDWFLDEYYGSVLYPGLAGHYVSGTQGTFTLDEETLPAQDSSLFFIRKVLTAPKPLGYGQPLISPTLRGEWYHFNGGFKYEDGTGGVAKNTNNKVLPAPVRGNPGVPDSGIGPARIVGILTKIGTYVPPGKGRHSIWARQVSRGRFDPAAAHANGRFLSFNPGHGSTEYTDNGGWMGDMFLASLRWVAKDDRGCMRAGNARLNPAATVNEEGECAGVGLSRDVLLSGGGEGTFGRVVRRGSAFGISLERGGPHDVTVANANGETVFQVRGEGTREYDVSGLAAGHYVIQVTIGGKTFRKVLASGMGSKSP